MRLGIVTAITAYFVSITPTAMATPIASEALCGGLTWPRPMPDVVAHAPRSLGSARK